MKCPHCTTSFHEAWRENGLGQQPSDLHYWFEGHLICPECKQIVVRLRRADQLNQTVRTFVAHPRSSGRPRVSADVPAQYREDYTEAALILLDSPKASAALSRRVLQHLLREVLKVTPGNLANEIKDVLSMIPSYLHHIDAIRNVGNFSAHPMKDTNTAEIIDVEPEEAEWMLDILDDLFEFLFVGPAVVKRKKDALNEKLRAAGKPEMQ